MRDVMSIGGERTPEYVPDGWFTVTGLATHLGKDFKFIRKRVERERSKHPEWFKNFVGAAGKLREFLHPALVARIQKEVEEAPEAAPDEWKTVRGAAAILSKSHSFIKKRVESCRLEHPEWFKQYTDVRTDRVEEFLHPDFFALLQKTVDELPKPAPEGWMTVRKAASKLSIGPEGLKKHLQSYRVSNPEWFGIYLDVLSSQPEEFLHPDLLAAVQKDREELPEPAPEGWMTFKSLMILTKKSTDFIRDRLELFRANNPECVKRYFDVRTDRVEEFLHPDFVASIQKEIGDLPASAPEDWRTAFGLTELLQRSQGYIASHLVPFRITHPEWFRSYLNTRTNRVEEFIHPDLMNILLMESRAGERLCGELKSFLEDVQEGRSLDSKVFNKLIAFCGSSRALDILFRFRPEYRAILIDDVQKILADYLGDYLMVKRPFNFRDAKEAAEFFSDETLKGGLFETLKRDCLSFYYVERRRDSQRSDREIIDAYLQRADAELGELRNADVDEVVFKTIDYFETLFTTIERPQRMIEQLREGRDFPDVNQRINMRELQEKNRVLIADEMGLGKSGSSIFAKEAIGVKQALLVVPSGLIPTWLNYLSADRERGGYFKPGEAPRVLVVEDPLSLKAEDVAGYDYVIVSHERLNENYAPDLQKLNFDMMIVDESHLLKNTAGKRGNNLLELAKKLEGEDKYLALLSGTPIPNTVNDLAMVLRLLYPDKFEGVEQKKMVAQIVQGDILDLRSLLLPRMQMKSLRESVEMPELREDLHEIELSSSEQLAYEFLLEEDELTPMEKMVLLRRFLLNPELVDPTPGIESAKLREVQEDLREVFTRHDKVMMFVNGYITDIIRGELSILEKLDLPGVEIKTIHGTVPPRERERIQQEVRQAGGKILLVMGGQTGGVGLDFSSMDEVFFYNEPWTEYDRQQQLARVYRPGLDHTLQSRTFIAAGTLEEGLHRHIQAKYRSIEKLLRGIPLTELEQELLKRSSGESDLPPGAEVNPELAKYYFSSWDRMMSIFAYVKEIGESDFQKFLENFSRAYADCYLELGSRSYQANANRVSGAIIRKMIDQEGGDAASTRILDVAAGPEMLKRHIADELQENVVSLDLNAEHFAPDNQRRFVGSFLQMPFEAKAFDYASMTLAWHYTNFAPSKGKVERVQVLHEMNRVLRDGGHAVLNMIYSLDFKEAEKFRAAVALFGFEVVEELSGDVEEEGRYRSKVITLQKIHEADKTVDELVEELRSKDLIKAFKFKETEGRLKDSRRIVKGVTMNGKRLEIDFNDADRAIYEEEQKIIGEGEGLKKEYGSIENIPKETVIAKKFVRIDIGKRYVLFKKLETGPGAVIVK